MQTTLTDCRGIDAEIESLLEEKDSTGSPGWNHRGIHVWGVGTWCSNWIWWKTLADRNWHSDKLTLMGDWPSNFKAARRLTHKLKAWKLPIQMHVVFYCDRGVFSVRGCIVLGFLYYGSLPKSTCVLQVLFCGIFPVEKCNNSIMKACCGK